MPFVNTVFSELTTLGFIGLLLFVITKLDFLSTLSQRYLGEKEKLQETIEVLHMGLFLFIVIFLVLCCTLLKLGVSVQSEWREFERGAEDVGSVMSDFCLATEPPATFCEKISLARTATAKKSHREIVYLALRRRFVDFRSNHPDPEQAKLLEREFQRNLDIRFPFNEYLSIISGEVMARLIEIDPPTWIALELVLVLLLVVCWQFGEEGEIWTLLFFGFSLILLNEAVYVRIRRMRRLLTPPGMMKDAERLRRKNEWRAKHHLPLHETNEKSWILESADTNESDSVPPYVDMLPQGGRELSEHELKIEQRRLMGGRGNGVLLALFCTRMVFLLTAMHLSVFLMRTAHIIHHTYAGHTFGILVLYVLFLLPSFVVTGMSLKIARDGLYAFNVEHMKSSRVIAKVMRVLKARQTLRTLRFVAEMKIYLRETVRSNSIVGSQRPITATLHQASAKFSHAASNTGSVKQRKSGVLSPSRRKSSIDEVVSPPLSPLAAYTTMREKRSGAYKLEMERREIHSIFVLFDTDGSGKISRLEMAQLLRAVTHELDDNQVNRLMEDLVEDDEDEITRDAFTNWCHQHIQDNKHSKEELIEEIFNMVDADHSGFITVDEFIAIFRALGQALDHDDVRELIYQMDRNDDGKIDLEEFTKMLQKHEV